MRNEIITAVCLIAMLVSVNYSMDALNWLRARNGIAIDGDAGVSERVARASSAQPAQAAQATPTSTSASTAGAVPDRKRGGGAVPAPRSQTGKTAGTTTNLGDAFKEAMSEIELDAAEQNILDEIGPKITEPVLIIIIMSYCAVLKEWEKVKRPKKYLLSYLNVLNENETLDMTAVDNVDREFIASVPIEEQAQLSLMIRLTIQQSTALGLSSYMS